MDVGGWLRKLDLEQYEAAFRENNIDDTILRSLTREDLEELGVGSRRASPEAAGRHRRVAGRSLRTITASGRRSQQSRQGHRRAPPAHRDVLRPCRLDRALRASRSRGPSRVISAYQSCVAETVRRFGGFVAKYMGDGVLVYFGYPQAHEDDAERAVRAGLAMIDAVAAARTLTRPAGADRIATGLVVVGDLSDRAKRRSAALSARRRTWRRACKAWPSRQVVIAEGTRKLVGNLFELQDLGPNGAQGHRWAGAGLRGAAGKFGREPLRGAARRRPDCAGRAGGRVRIAAAALGESQGRRRPGGAAFRRGRHRQIAAYRGAVWSSFAGEPHTRLRYFCSPQHTDSALYPVIGQLERAAGFAHDDTPQAKLDKLDALLAQTATSGRTRRLFAEMLSLPNDGRYPASSLPRNSAGRRRWRHSSRNRKPCARSSPVLMIFEDAHWIDPTSLEAFGRTVERIANLRVLLIVTFRPEFEPPWIGRPHVTALALNRLAQREVDAMIDRVAGNKPLPRTSGRTSSSAPTASRCSSRR